MGCDIHSYSEKFVSGKWEQCEFKPFDWRHYGVFGFLAGVRNYSAVTPLSEKRGLPEDHTLYECEEESYDWDGHSASWFMVSELLDFDYDQMMEDRRVTINNNGGCTCAEGEGEIMTYREFLGECYFNDLAKLQEIGAERIVFWFDN